MAPDERCLDSKPEIEISVHAQNHDDHYDGNSGNDCVEDEDSGPGDPIFTTFTISHLSI